MTGPVSIRCEDNLLILRLTRPEKKNALTASMYAALCDALERGEEAPEVAVHVILGSDGVFTAGNDLADFAASAQQPGVLANVLRFVRLLPRLKKPLIAGVDGIAIGIGTTLLFHCDLVYATPSARFATPFLDLGLVPEAGSSWLAPRLMGPAKAFELLVLGNTFSAEQARDARFVNDIIPAETLEDSVKAAGYRLAAKPPRALALARSLLRGDPREILDRIDEEADNFGRCLASPEAQEAFAAFHEKRQPNFSRLVAKE